MDDESLTAISALIWCFSKNLKPSLSGVYWSNPLNNKWSPSFPAIIFQNNQIKR